jgi:hypothetical protein
MRNRLTRLHPPLKAGIICLGIHQALVLISLASLWFHIGPLLILSGYLLIFVDLPAVFLSHRSGFFNWAASFEAPPETSLSLFFEEYFPFVLSVAVPGAVQWFLIGYLVCAARRMWLERISR